MPRPEGHKMTTVDTSGADGGENLDADAGAEGGDADAASLEADPKDPNAFDEQAGDQDPESGSEDQTPGEGAGEDEAAQGDANEEPAEGVDPKNEIPEPILEQLTALNQKLETAIKGNGAPAAQEITEEQWQKFEQDWGQPRQTIQKVTEVAQNVYAKVMQAMDERMAQLEIASDMHLKRLAREKGFEDALAHKAGIQKFLERFDPRHHTNPDLLKMGVVFARGLKSNTNVQKVRKEVERNRKIAGAGRPSAPNGGQRPSVKPLTPAQRQAASMLPGGEKEYRSLMTRRGAPIAQ